MLYPTPRCRLETLIGRVNTIDWVRRYVWSIIERKEWSSPFNTDAELEKLKFQSSDDMNDCVKYISAINDKLNQVELQNQNQHVFAECLIEW